MVSTSVTVENIIHMCMGKQSESFLVCTCAVSGTYWKRIKQPASVQWFKNRNHITRTHAHTQTHSACSSEIEEAKSIWVAEPSLIPPFFSLFSSVFFFFLLCLICPFLAFSFSSFARCTIRLRQKTKRQQTKKSKDKIRERKRERSVKWKTSIRGNQTCQVCITAVPRACVWVTATCKRECVWCSSVCCCVHLSSNVCICWNVCGRISVISLLHSLRFRWKKK